MGEESDRIIEEMMFGGHKSLNDAEREYLQPRGRRHIPKDVCPVNPSKITREKAYWITAKGERLLMKDMPAKHLYNSRDMMIREQKQGLKYFNWLNREIRYREQTKKGAKDAPE